MACSQTQLNSVASGVCVQDTKRNTIFVEFRPQVPLSARLVKRTQNPLLQVLLSACLLQNDEDIYQERLGTGKSDPLFSVSRTSEILESLTRNRAAPPKNRRRPSLKKRHETSEIFSNEDDEYSDKV